MLEGRVNGIANWLASVRSCNVRTLAYQDNHETEAESIR
jgi:hypothetical protein